MSLVVLLTALLLVVPAGNVFAAAYDGTYWIFSLDDAQKRSWADLRVWYECPDRVRAGRALEVAVTLQYQKNEHAHMAWVEVYNFAVHLRSSPEGLTIASSVVDTSRLRLTPGSGEYSHTFSVDAPQTPGQYVAALVWKTLHSRGNAYGYSMYSHELDWDTARMDPEDVPRLIVYDEGALSIRLENVDEADVSIDGQRIEVRNGEAQATYLLDSSHTVEVPDEVALGEGSRAVFVKWSDGDKANPRQIVLTDDTELVAVYRIQYFLKVVSDFDDPQGEDWYDAGSEATVSVDSPQPETGLLGSLGAKKVFQEWSGDLTSDSRTATIKMDGPKSVKAEWTTESSQAYVVLGGIAAAIIVGIAAIFLVSRRRAPPRLQPMQPVRPAAPPTYAPPPAARPPPPTTYPPPPPVQVGVKHCIHCGAEIPSVVVYCTNCGRRQ